MRCRAVPPCQPRRPRPDDLMKFPPNAPPSVPLAHCPADRLAAVLGVFTDIDDTLTRDGAIEPQALHALHALRAAGVPVVAITGRPLGWSEPFARTWPVDAIVAENGAVALIPAADGGLTTEFAQDRATREANTLRLQRAAARVLAEVPGAALALDSAGRVTDIAVDHSEHARLDAETVERIVALMQDEGLTATVSSIHVNGWFGHHTKLSAAHWMTRRLYGRELGAEIDRWLYVGDSTNDQAMFQHFPLAVGVANLLRFAAELQHWPAWLTRGERGEGFAEVAVQLLAAREAQAQRVRPAAA
jgi:HAD superfamily hydrolase (TIGR01484 family)